MKKIIVITIFVLLVGSMFAFGPSKRVYFQIKDASNLTPATDAVTFTASLWNAQWSGLIAIDNLTQTSEGCDYHLYRNASGTQNDIGFITIDCGSFETDLISLYTFIDGTNVPTRYPKIHLEYEIDGSRETGTLDLALNGSSTQVFVKDDEGSWAGGMSMAIENGTNLAV